MTVFRLNKFVKFPSPLSMIWSLVPLYRTNPPRNLPKNNCPLPLLPPSHGKLFLNILPLPYFRGTHYALKNNILSTKQNYNFYKVTRRSCSLTQTCCFHCITKSITTRKTNINSFAERFFKWLTILRCYELQG